MWQQLKDAWHAVQAKLTSFWVHVEPALEADAVQLMEALGEIALGAVLKQIPLIASGAEKFNQAVLEVVHDAKTQGIAVSQIMAQKAVQDVVTNIAAANGATMIAAIPADPVKATAVINLVAKASLDAPPATNDNAVAAAKVDAVA